MAPEKVKRNRVSLEPINSFLATDNHGLIMGDDPGNESGLNGFTVAPIDIDSQRQGYIYAILGSEKISNITDVLQRSLIMKWSSSAVVMALAFAFIAGLLLFFFLMRKLRVLSLAMQEFKDSNLQPANAVARADAKPLDEIETMAMTFQEMAQRIHTQMNHLQEVESLRRELVANVSHDLRTPLASLSGFLETLQLKSSDLSEAEKQNYLRIAWDNAQRLTTLVEELFELAKLDANEIQPQQEAFSPAELAFDVSHQFYLRAREKNINFEVVADKSVPQVSADVGMIERVLENLIDNSFKHTPEQGQIRLHLSALHGNVEISVSDTGCGIAKEEMPHILKRFYRKIDKQDSSGTQSGLGLGLAIASRIVEMHGSQLVVHSELNQGTVFSFALPVCA
jgi:signal transduction histidine kinase